MKHSDVVDTWRGGVGEPPLGAKPRAARFVSGRRRVRGDLVAAGFELLDWAQRRRASLSL